MPENTDHDLLVRLDEKMDTVMAWQKEHKANCHTTHEDHENRLRNVEQAQGRQAGGLAVLVVLMEVGVTKLKQWFGGP